jgi:hypothetical protein
MIWSDQGQWLYFWLKLEELKKPGVSSINFLK